MDTRRPDALWQSRHRGFLTFGVLAALWIALRLYVVNFGSYNQTFLVSW